MAGFHQKKKKIHLSNIAAGYVGLITKMSLKTEFWKLKTPKCIFSFHNSSLQNKKSCDGNNDPKLIQTNAHLWDPHDLDDGNRKLSDITQNSSPPNKLLLISNSLNVKHRGYKEKNIIKNLDLSKYSFHEKLWSYIMYYIKLHKM